MMRVACARGTEASTFELLNNCLKHFSFIQSGMPVPVSSTVMDRQRFLMETLANMNQKKGKLRER